MTANIPDDLLDPAIIRSVRVLLQSEVGGAQAAAIAERYARNSVERDTWSALLELEIQTRDAVYEHLGDAAAQFGASVRSARAIGAINGATGTLLPHRWQLHSMVTATKLFVPHFRRLEQHFAHSPRAAFFSYVLEHELAIAEAGKRTLANVENPMEPVEALLGGVPS
jgi:hypothetical protein